VTDPNGSEVWFGRIPRVPERAYRQVTLVTVLAVLLLIGTGGWVRLSESGLGCPTWPACYGNDLVAHDSYHSLVEFVNRCAITGVAVLIGVAVIGAVLQAGRRRDLVWLSAGLFAGYVAEAVLGGLTVLFKLAPALVCAHLVVAMVLLANAVVLHWRAGHHAASAARPTGRDVRLLARLLLVALGFVVVAGTVATGTGPDAGSADVARFGFRFPATVELHAVLAVFFCGLTVAMFFALRGDGASPAVFRAYEIMLAATVLQGAVGYTQYFNGLPIDVIEVHIVGAGILLIATVRFNLALGARSRRRLPPPSPAPALAVPEASPSVRG
jgi:heme a synthase